MRIKVVKLYQNFKLVCCAANISLKLSLATIMVANLAQALPFNDDMVDSQLKAGQVMRALPKDSVPIGSTQDYYTSKEEALTAENTVPTSIFSLANGKRLYRVNCYPCHGTPSKDNYQPGPVTRYMPGPNLALDMYHQKKTGSAVGIGRTDAEIFSSVRFGNIIMPPVGWKLAKEEIWDIVNYIREVQEK